MLVLQSFLRYNFDIYLYICIHIIIRVMCSNNGSSLEVSYLHLGECAPILAIWLADVPKYVIIYFVIKFYITNISFLIMR